MYNTEDIFKVLSGEKKALKPSHAYKTAEEGLLKAMYFFRWANKTELKNADKIAEKFISKKIPEQQVEHFGSALIMIDHYETEPQVKDALKYINEKVQSATGAPAYEQLESDKIKRRVLKNIYQSFNDSIVRLKERTEQLKSSSATSWIAIVVLLIINAALAIFGIYQNILTKSAPQALASNPVINQYGAYIIAVLLFVIPASIILFVKRHQMAEHKQKGSDYPEEIKKMEETLEEFKRALEKERITL